MSKTMQYVYKGGIAVAALLASLMLLLPYIVATMEIGFVSATIKPNLFDAWEVGLDGADADAIIMVICYSVVFFLGLILAVASIISMFIDNELFNMILKVAAVILAVLAIVGLICNFVAIEGASIGAAGIVSAIFSVATAGLIWAEKSLVK